VRAMGAPDGRSARLRYFQAGPGPVTPGPATRSVSYQNIGTTIAAAATQADDVRFRVTLTVDRKLSRQVDSG
jgi:hypothetical protein